MKYTPRILRVVYRSNHHPRRVASVVVKVPYSGIYGLSETLARAISTEEIMWYRIERVPPKDISRVRSTLGRGPEGLTRSSGETGVTWES